MKKPTKTPVIRSSLHNASRAGRAAKRWHLTGVQGAAAPDLADDGADDQNPETPETPSAA